MERAMSVEEKIRRAEEIYARRQEGTQRKTATVTVNNKNKKDLKLLKKMVIQILVSLSIYMVIYVIQNNNYIFSEEFLNKANEILSHDMNFEQIYNQFKQNIEKKINEMKNNNENGIGGAEENNIEDSNIIENSENSENENKTEENVENEVQTTEGNANIEQLSQEEQDIANIKATTTFIKPVEGTISSRFGQREPTTSTTTVKIRITTTI